MSDIKFKVKITAVGEVRDKDGNLLSSEPVEAEAELTESELIELNLPVPVKEK
jgi:hypothetical protein